MMCQKLFSTLYVKMFYRYSGVYIILANLKMVSISISISIWYIAYII